MHQSFKRRVAGRSIQIPISARPIQIVHSSNQGWSPSDVAAVTSAVVALAALAFGYVQFKETVRL